MTATTQTVPVESEKTLGLGVQVGYGMGQVAGQVFRDTPSLLLLFFMTTVLGIAPAIAGAAIFVPKLVFGMGCDLLVGVLSDRLQHRFHRRWWLLVGAIGTPLAMILLFHVPVASTTTRVVYLVSVFSFYMAVYASFSVPYLSIAGELAASPRLRNVLMAWRLVFTAVGVLVSGMMAPAIIQANGSNQHAYEVMALVLAAVCPVALLVAFFGSAAAERETRLVTQDDRRNRISPRQAIALLVAPRFSVLLSANILQLTGAGMGYASMLYFLTYNMGRPDAFLLIGGLAIAACAGIVVAQPFWVALAARIGKRHAYVAATALYVATYVVWSFGAHWGVTAAYTLSFIAAIGNSGWAMLGFSMMSDVASDDSRNAGLYSAAWVASEKISFALGGMLLVGLILSAFGFDSVRAVAGLPQSERALIGTMVAFGLGPAFLNFVGGVILLRWGRN